MSSGPCQSKQKGKTARGQSEPRQDAGGSSEERGNAVSA